ncbi:MAG: hypothetical protein ACW96N_04375 [Candidatus Thorarchaeota archaeon]|jgi:hypothetical protein
MSLEKAKLKAHVLHTVGTEIEDFLESAVQGMSEQQGAARALTEAAKRISQSLSQVDRDMESGKITLSEADLVKKYINNCIGVVKNAQTGAASAMLKQQGKIDALKHCVSLLEKMHTTETQKAKHLESKENAEETTRGRPVGIHPGPSIKDRRIKESKESFDVTLT